MPWGVAAGVLGSVAGAAVSGAMAPSSSGGSGGGPGSYYVPTGLSAADQQWQDLQNRNYLNYTNQNLGQYGLGSLTAGLGNIPRYAAQVGTGGAQAGNQYTLLGQQLEGASGNQFAGGNQIYQTAFDPQNALYNRTVQQLQDQTGATNSMYGLGSSAAGAGVANQALGNFNIDWQNQQLQRQIAGLGAAGQAYGQGGQLGQAGAQASLQGGYLPYETAQYLAGQPAALAGQYGSFLNANVYGPAQGIQDQFIPYANYGQGAQAIPYQNQAQGAGAAGALGSQAISQGISGLGNAYQNAGGWGNLFGGTTGSFGGGDFSGAFTGSPYYSGGGNSYGFTM